VVDWIRLLEHNPSLLYGSVALFGLVVGSFLNVVIHRLPKMDAGRRLAPGVLGFSRPGARDGARSANLTLAHPPSHCRHWIRPSENIPLLSYLVLRGRCAACGGAIGRRYPLVEAMTALLFVLVVQRLGIGWETLAILILTGSLITLAAIDLDTGLLPDVIALPLLWVGPVLSLAGWFTDSRSVILGAALGYLIL